LGLHSETKAFAETLLKDSSPFNDPSDNLYRVLTLTAKDYTETLLKNKSPGDTL